MLKRFKCWTDEENDLYQEMARAWHLAEGGSVEGPAWEGAYLSIAGRMRQLALGERSPASDADEAALRVADRAQGESDARTAYDGVRGDRPRTVFDGLPPPRGSRWRP